MFACEKHICISRDLSVGLWY